MSDLKPCPFCGSRDGIMPCDYRVTCRRCSATGPNGDSVSQAMRLWDSRTPSPKLELPQEVREAMAMAVEDKAWAERCVSTRVEHPGQFAALQTLAALVRRLLEREKVASTQADALGFARGREEAFREAAEEGERGRKFAIQSGYDKALDMAAGFKAWCQARANEARALTAEPAKEKP